MVAGRWWYMPDNWLMFMVYDGIFTYINGWFNSSARSWSQTVLRFWLAPIQPDLLGQMNPWNRSPIRTSDRQSSREWFFTISIIFFEISIHFLWSLECWFTFFEKALKQNVWCISDFCPGSNNASWVALKSATCVWQCSIFWHRTHPTLCATWQWHQVANDRGP